MLSTIITTITALTLFTNPLVSPFAGEKLLATHEMSLAERYYPVKKENILLNLAYMDGRVKSKADINWDEIQKPFTMSFKLNPGEVFAYHDDILPEYKGKIIRTTNTHFNYQEGYKSAGYLVGDGVCHLASLMYWVALDAGLKAKAPANHNFMAIPGIEKTYGVSIYSNPMSPGSNTIQNLYITNNLENSIEFMFEYSNEILKLSVLEIN